MPIRVSRGLFAGLATMAIALLPLVADAAVYDLTVDRVTIDTGEFTKTGIGFNGASPGPVLRFREGEEVTINVTNNLGESTSIHWHGLILPADQDGVPNISYDGIDPGETFSYHFNMAQSGTYWYHSHTDFQEPDGAYGAIVIEPTEREPFRYDREYVVQLTDTHRHSGSRIMRNLKMMPDYYNRQQRTAVDLVRDISANGLAATLAERAAWGSMRMMPTDIEDVQGFVPLINGEGPEENWTGLFEPGERVRLRFINSSAMTYFDIRIPGLEMTVVQADGQNVQPVTVDELRIAVAETYDVIVHPKEDRAYTIFGESMGRTAYARGTLAPRPGMTAEVPEMREDPLLTMADMGMAHEGMDHGAMAGMNHGATQPAGEQHTMPDGTVMQGEAMPMQQQHTMPDGTVMQGEAMPMQQQHTMPGGTVMQGGTMPMQQHTMPDGTVMQDGTMPMQQHIMPDGTTMPGGAMPQPGSGTMQMNAAPPQPIMPRGTHTMPDGTVMLDESHEELMSTGERSSSRIVAPSSMAASQAAMAGTHVMPDGTTMAGTDHGAMDHGTMAGAATADSHTMPDGTTMAGTNHPAMDHGTAAGAATAASHAMPDGTAMAGMDHGAMAGPGAAPFYAPGSGLTPTAANGGRFLSYADLKAQAPLYPDREPTREIEIRLTGNMERYIWSINGVKFEDAEPIRLRYGERVRFKFVNETMMSHPMHLHGMWSILDNGSGRWNPLKHTVSIAPGTTLYTETEVDAPGAWAFHCHLSYHAEAGMFRKVVVEGGPAAQARPAMQHDLATEG